MPGLRPDATTTIQALQHSREQDLEGKRQEQQSITQPGPGTAVPPVNKQAHGAT